MKSKRIIHFSILFTTLLYASNIKSQTFEWARSFGGIYSDHGNAVVADDAGNVYTTGGFDAATDFDPGPGTYILSPNNNTDIFVHKMDPQGNFLWVKNFGSSSAESGYSMNIDDNDQLYITGYFAGTMIVNTISGIDTLTPKGSADIYILKMDGDGNVFWAKSFGGAQGDSGYTITVDQAGNVYTAGTFSATMNIIHASDTLHFTSNGKADVFIQKMNTDGNFIWARTFGGTSGDYPQSIAVDDNGNVYTTGYFDGTVDFDPGSDSLWITATNDDMFLHKLDANGNFQWVKTGQGPSGSYGQSIALDEEGNIITTGIFRETLDFDPMSNDDDLTSAGDTDIFIQKINPAGQVLWSKSIGSSGLDIGWSLYLDDAGNVYNTGVFSETVDFDSGAGAANLTSIGKSDIYVQKMDANGNFIWAQSFGGAGNDEAYAVSVDAQGNIFLAGTIEETVTISAGGSAVTFTSAGGDDVFVLKLSQMTSNISNATQAIPVWAYPNPTNGPMTISMEKPMDNVNIKIIDVHGKLVSSTFYTHLLHEKIEIPGHSGIYFLHLQSDNTQSVIKMIKE